MLISRLVPPTTVTEPTPRTFSSRFFECLFGPIGQLDRPTCGAGAAAPPPASGRTATDHTARADGSKRNTRGSLTSVRSSGLMAATFSRTSSAALRPSTCKPELDDHHRLAFVAARGQRVDAGDRIDAFLDLLGHLALDDLG